MRGLLIVLFAVLAACAGCAGLRTYATDRGNDFLDCFVLMGGVGLIHGVDLPAAMEVRATDWLDAGLGKAVSMRAGLNGRRIGEGELDAQLGLPILPFATWFGLRDAAIEKDDGPARHAFTFYSSRHGGGGEDESRTAKSILVFNAASIPRYRAYKEIGYPASYPTQEREERPLIHAFDVSVDATLLLSARVGFSPGEFVDLVLGFFGADIARDDARSRKPAERPGPASRPAPTSQPGA